MGKLFISYLLFSALVVFASAESIYVATTGSNTKGNGTLASPFADLLFAYNRAEPGDIVYVLGGTYGTPAWNQGYWFQGRSGTSSASITIKNYNGQRVVIDGSLNLGVGYTIVEFINVEYIVLDGLEIKNARGAGGCIWSTQASHITIQNSIVHDCAGTCMQVAGTYNQYLNNQFYNCVLVNAHSTATGAWPNAVSGGGMQSTGQPSSHIVFRGNYIYNTWGEALGVGMIDTVEVTHNVIVNPFSCGIYLNHARNANISDNYVDVSDRTFKRGDNGNIAIGIGLSVEYHTTNVATFGIQNVVISNNIIVRSFVGINYWQDTRNTFSYANYQNLQILNNLVLYPDSYALSLDGPSGSSVTLMNNIFYSGESVIWLNSGITAKHNDYVAGIPSFDKSGTSIASDPLFAEISLATKHNGKDVSQAVSGLRLRSNSPCKNRGIHQPNVLVDFSGTLRPVNPSLGPLE